MHVYSLIFDVKRFSAFDTVSDDDEANMPLLHWAFGLVGPSTDHRLPPERLLYERSSCGYHVSEPNNLPTPDFGYAGLNMIIVSQRAATLCGDLLDGFTHCFGPIVRDTDGIGYSVNRVIAAFDYENAIYKLWLRGGFEEVTKFAFHLDRLKNVPLFLLPGLRGQTFATDLFKERVEENSLTGLIFKPAFPDNSKEEEREKLRQKYLKKRKR